MKKKLEAELISIAHRILKLKNKSELVQLHQETQKLYEKLSVLRFVEENFADVKPTIGYSEIEQKVETVFENENAVANETQPETTPEPTEIENVEPLAEAEVPEENVSETEKEETVEATEEEATKQSSSEETEESESTEENTAATENTEEVVSEPEAIAEVSESSEPAKADDLEENAKDPIAETESPEEQVSEVEEQETQEAEHEETLASAETPEESKVETKSNDSFKPSFELAFDPKEDPDTDKFNTPAQTSLEDFLHHNYVDPVFVTPEDLQKEKEEKAAQQSFSAYQTSSEAPSKSLNDRMAKGIIIGLNDRIAFMNHLFNNSSEDYNRVLSQLMTIDTFGEAKNFIDTMVKPDYNDWAGKEEYEQRFLEIIEKKFS